MAWWGSTRLDSDRSNVANASRAFQRVFKHRRATGASRRVQARARAAAPGHHSNLRGKAQRGRARCSSPLCTSSRGAIPGGRAGARGLHRACGDPCTYWPGGRRAAHTAGSFSKPYPFQGPYVRRVPPTSCLDLPKWRRDVMCSMLDGPELQFGLQVLWTNFSVGQTGGMVRRATCQTRRRGLRSGCPLYPRRREPSASSSPRTFGTRDHRSIHALTAIRAYCSSRSSLR